MKMAKPKQVKKKEPKLDISRVIKAVDSKNYEFYDSLNDEERKGFSPYVLMRFISSAPGTDREVQEHFVEMTNELINKNHWELSNQHPALMWKLYAATGAGVSCFHQYLPTLKYEFDKFENLIGELNPAMKPDEVKMLASMMDENDREELFDHMGFDATQRKKYK
jgi:hypothetical protein